MRGMPIGSQAALVPMLTALLLCIVPNQECFYKASCSFSSVLSSLPALPYKGVPWMGLYKHCTLYTIAYLKQNIKEKQYQLFIIGYFGGIS